MAQRHELRDTVRGLLEEHLLRRAPLHRRRPVGVAERAHRTRHLATGGRSATDG